MKDAEDKKKFKESCEKEFGKRFNIIDKVPDKSPKMDKPEQLFKEIKEFVKAPEDKVEETESKEAAETAESETPQEEESSSDNQSDKE